MKTLTIKRDNHLDLKLTSQAYFRSLYPFLNKVDYFFVNSRWPDGASATSEDAKSS